jgi:hypothetical protein
MILRELLWSELRMLHGLQSSKLLKLLRNKLQDLLWSTLLCSWSTLHDSL